MADQPFPDSMYQAPSELSANTAPQPTPEQFSPPRQAGDFSLPAVPAAPKKKLALVLAIVGVAILLAGGGAWAYLTYFPTPEKIIDKTFANLAAVTSVEYEGEAVVEGDASSLAAELPLATGQAKPGATKATATVTFSGSSDTHQLAESKSAFAINFASAGLPGEQNYHFGAEFRAVNKAFYANFSDLPNLGFIDLSPLKNQWIKIDFAALAETLGKGDQAKQLEQSSAVTPEQEQKLREALKISKIITVTAKLAAEDVNGEPSYHFRFTINREGVKQFITELRQTLENTKGSGDKSGLGELYYQVDTAKELPQGELWIGKRDYLPRKLTFAGTLPSTDKKVPPPTYRVNLTFKSFNQPVAVEPPASSRSIEDILKEMMGPMMIGLLQGEGQPNAMAFGDETDSDGDGLPDAIEVKIGTDPHKADTDGDGFSDGVEVENFFNPKGPGKLSNADQAAISEAFGFGPTGLAEARLKSRDAKRVADIKQTQTALELYFGDNNHYPAGSNLILGETSGKVLTNSGFGNTANGSTTTYMGAVPSNPTPGGANYVYSQLNGGKDYTLTFSLEGTTGGLSAGNHTANSSGISGQITDWQTQAETPANPPTNYALATPKGRDDKRISDIKQVQTAIELYYGDNNQYPTGSNLALGMGSAKVLINSGFAAAAPTGGTVFMGTVPTNPSPGGVNYVYTQAAGGQDYTITFALETGTGSLAAGPHIATMNGIK